LNGSPSGARGLRYVICLKHSYLILTRVDKVALQKTHIQWIYLPLSAGAPEA
jgi:hypothetical protein